MFQTILYFILVAMISADITSSKLLVLVPSLEDNTTLPDQIEKLYSSKGDVVDIECLVLTCLNFSSFPHLRGLSDRCEIMDVYLGSYSDYLKTAVPSMVRTSGFSHIMILQGTISLSESFDLAAFMKVMGDNNLHVASPEVVKHGESSEHHVSAGQIGYETEVVELYAAVYTLEAWSCQWDIIDPGLNPAGLGYDHYYYNCCRPALPSLRMGIITRMKAKVEVPHRHHKGLKSDYSGLSNLCDSTFLLTTGQSSHKDQMATWAKHLKVDRNYEMKLGKKRLPTALV